MSKCAFACGLIISAAGHWYALFCWSPAAWAVPAPEMLPTPEVAEIVDMASDAEELPVAVPTLAEPSPATVDEVDKHCPASERPGAAAPEPPQPSPVTLSGQDPVQDDDTDADGDLAGRSDGMRRPMLRIDWGTTDEAARVLEIGQMKLVALNEDNSFDRELVYTNGQWKQRPFAADAQVEYSNGLRIVSAVAAFAPARNALERPNAARLAVLVPRDVEQMLLTAQEQAASGRYLTYADVRTFGGRFVLTTDGLGFEITHVVAQRD